MTRFVLTPVGSSGDVHPYLGIGRELKSRGHEVIVIVNAAFERSVEREGLAFVPFGTEEDYYAITENPDLWHPQKGIRLVMGRIAEELRTAYDLIDSVFVPGSTVLVGHSLAFATRTFEEKHAVPSATIHLAPVTFRSEFAQPAVAPGLSFNSLPRPLKRFLWRSLDRFLIDPMVAPALNEWRSSLGLSPVSRVFHTWIHSPSRVLGLFPDWFAPCQPDWPPQLRLPGFPLFDDPGESSTNSEIEQWIANGDPPVVFTPGTANRHASAFFAAAAESLAIIGRRGLFLSQFSEHLPPVDPERVRHVRYLPFSSVLPRCAAIVHHGGIGTCAQGLAAGIPQIVMPMGFDQPDNAARLAKLGVGTWLTPRRFKGKRLARVLARLLNDEAVAKACQDARIRLAFEDGVAGTCDELERLA